MGKHRIYGRLDDPIRLVGLTIDELVPMAVVGVFCFLMHFYLTGLALLVIIHALMRHIKKGEGFEQLLINLFWVVPTSVHKMAFKRTPEFIKRHFIR